MDYATLSLMIGKLWVQHIAYAAVLSSPFLLLGRKRAEWKTWELVAFALPFWLWVALMLLGGKEKTLANWAEYFYISLSIPCCAAIRVIVGSKARGKITAIIAQALLVIVAVAIYLIMPSLPE